MRDPVRKITKAKKGGDMAQVVELLLASTRPLMQALVPGGKKAETI
jgi:hypothetical protein